MDSPKETSAVDAVLDDVLRLIVSDYEPADIHNFDTTYSTAELKTAAQEHTGDNFLTSDIVAWLKAHDYNAANIGQLSLVWLFRKKR